MVKSWSSSQTVIALSTGEAELYALNVGTAHTPGLQSMLNDLGFWLEAEIETDSNAAIGVVKRSGVGKIRHLDVTDLWCQEKVRTGAVTLHKVLGADNPADIMTKYTDRAILEKMLGLMNLRQMSGRAECAPAAAGC